MKIWKYNEENKHGAFKCIFIDTSKKRIIFCLANENWYTKGVERRIPIWINKNNPKGFSFFCYRLAIRLGGRVDNV